MSIEKTYREVLIEEFLQKQLQQGVSITSTALTGLLQQLVDSRDLSVPQFVSNDFYVVTKENSSASKFNNTFNTIRQDLRVLYREMSNLTQTSIESMERWKVEAEILEKKLLDLETRIENLLFLSKDTEGYYGIVVDNFTDTSMVDFDYTTVSLDLPQQTIQMNTTSSSSTRIFLNDLDNTKDVKFSVRSTSDFISREDASESLLSYPFNQTSRSWWTNVTVSKIKPVTCELLVMITPEISIPLSKINITLLDSVETSPMYITPLISKDNINFYQLPSNTFTQEVKKAASFSFISSDVKYIKFLLTKKGPDTSSSTSSFSYQFGFKEISLYSTTYSNTDTQYLITTPLYVEKADGEIADFEKITVEACDRKEPNTDIKYFITASNNPDVPITGNTTWIPITPTNEIDSPINPQVVDLGDIELVEFGDTEASDIDTEIVKLSYDKYGDEGFVNPANPFYLLSVNEDGDVEQYEESATTLPRYRLSNSNDRVLNYQIKDAAYTGSGAEAFSPNLNTFRIFRNIGIKGLNPDNPNNQVRGIQRGWKFEDPYYSCVIEILNPQGMSIDVGDKPIIIDDTKYTNKIDNSILTGKYGNNTGTHIIKVHKTNWKNVTIDLNSLSSLKYADPLYPYNHKLLIEGYQYGDLYPTTDEKIYTGVDLFAETILKKVSIFDMIHNIQPDNFDVFAFDRDAPNTHDNGNPVPTRLIVIKASDKYTDFMNERFIIRFHRINERKKYLRLKIELSTKDAKITPVVYGYKVKVG